MPKFFQAPRGTCDILPNDHDFFTFVKKVIRHRFRQSGFRRISTPIFEEAGLFKRAHGEDSELIEKELYTFEDRQNSEHALRPECTTGAVRSFIEHEMHNGPLPAELYYIEPCFRFERLKSGRRRQFWQFGAEILGENDPSIDAQLIYLGHRILSDLNIRENVTLKINTLGTTEDRKKYKDVLADFYAGKVRSLSPKNKEKFEQKRYLELLCPENEDEEILVKMAPKITDFLSTKSKTFFDTLCEYLKTFKIDYEIDYGLVRGRRYYSQTIFEFQEKNNQNKILSGGRYNGLIDKMGGPDIGGAGFSCGAERLIKLMKNNGVSVPHKDDLQIFVAATGLVAKKHALPILVKLREHGFHAVGVLGKTAIGPQLERAKSFEVPYSILIGDVEIKKKQVIVRDMNSGKQEWVATNKIIEHMDVLLGAPQQLDSTVDFLGHE